MNKDPRHATSLTEPYFQRFVILGSGHFGSLAFQRLAKRYPKATFHVVDLHVESAASISRSSNVTVHVEDAVAFLLRRMPNSSEWIIPAVPIHVAFLWTEARLRCRHKTERLAVPTSLDRKVPNAHRTSTGTVYSSFATFTCPDGCNEPDDFCTVTREPRKGRLYEILRSLRIPGYEVHVLRSVQLAPGVGGYTGSMLDELLESVSRKPGKHIIATSCSCHSVIDALRWS